MQISHIDIYRDGGSIEFQIERDGRIRRVWLETPFSGEPRTLRIDSVAVGRGEPAVTELLADIEEWWATISSGVQQRVREILAHKGPIYNPDAETMHASDLSHVMFVHDYVSRNYAA